MDTIILDELERRVARLEPSPVVMKEATPAPRTAWEFIPERDHEKLIVRIVARPLPEGA